MAKQKVTDKTVKKALTDGPRSNKELREQLGLEKADPKLDRKLQEMRKAGDIKIVGNRWAVSTVEKCPKCGGKGWVGKTPAA